MARITVEDCIDKFPSRFELVLVASNRARKLHSGEEPTLERNNDKNTVIALREIATESINSEVLKTDLVEEYQTVSLNVEEDLEQVEDNTIEENNTSDLTQEQSNIENELNNETKNNSYNQESSESSNSTEEDKL